VVKGIGFLTQDFNGFVKIELRFADLNFNMIKFYWEIPARKTKSLFLWARASIGYRRGKF